MARAPRCASGRSAIYYVYILQSEKNGKFYIGSTSNVERRLTEHNSGKTKSLKYLRPLRLVFKQEYNNAAQAKRIEQKLKGFKNRNIIQQIVNDGLIKIT